MASDNVGSFIFFLVASAESKTLLETLPGMGHLDNLFQCVTSLTGKNFLLAPILKLLSFSLKPFFCVLSLHVLVQSLSSSL